MSTPPAPSPLRSVRILLIALVATAACARGETAKLPGLDAPSEIRITAEDEIGPPLVVEGTIFAADGETPAPGVVLYVYQTDRTGLYATSGSIPRLRGYVRSDERGRYRYSTIRPASYPNSTNPQHIHTQLWGVGVPPQWNRDLLFADDPFLGERDRRDSAAAGRFGWICAARPDADGVTRCTHDLRLKTTGDRFEAGTRHGLDRPPAS